MTYTYLNRFALTSWAVLSAGVVLTAGMAVAQPAPRSDGTVNDMDTGPSMQADTTKHPVARQAVAGEASADELKHGEYVLVRPAAGGMEDMPQRIRVEAGERPQMAYPPSPRGGAAAPADEHGIRWQP